MKKNWRKKFNKKTILGIIIILTVTLQQVFARESENILLPDLTTEVQGDSKEKKPDIGEYTADTNFNLPKMIEVEEEIIEEVEVTEEVKDTISEPLPKRPILFDGLVGVGFPGIIIEDLSVQNSSSENPNPFKIKFTHETSEGYFGKPFSNGFNDKMTLVYGEKRFTLNNFKIDIAGKIETNENGLQNFEPEITSFNQRAYNGKADFSWNLPKGFLLSTSFDGGFYNRFADSLPNSTLPGWVENISVITLMPRFNISWQNEDAGVNAFFDAKYNYDKNKSKNFISEEKVLHRGEFKIGLSWENDFVKLFADAAAVIGTEIGDNKVIVPFKAGVTAHIPVSFSERNFDISAEGGLQSGKADIEKLETAYKFSLLNFIPSETSDWFGTLKIEIPVRSSFTATLLGEYKQTALGNGIWQPVYETAFCEKGGYKYAEVERTFVKTYEAFSYTYKIFTITAGWLSFWNFVPEGYGTQNVAVDLIFTGENNKWGAALKSSFGIIAKDTVPKINLEGFVQVKPQVRIAVEVEDVIKLIKMSPRTYAGKYSSRSGTASVFVKINL